MRTKIGIKLTENYSINFSLPKRLKNQVKFIILHYTGMKKESEALKKLCDPNSEVSSHYYIKNNGEILNLVPDLYQAWHAGKSNWKNLKSLNKYSIGIELTNPGHQYGYRNFSLKQISSTKVLLKYLIKKYKINKGYILGHSDISPNRKKDPGEKFPWHELGKNRLCLWHKLDLKKLKELRNVWLSSQAEETRFFKNLFKIGYVKVSKKKSDLKYLVKAFQRRFRNQLINGKIDKECLLISKNLLNL
tara:strand:+ start:595 stop:1335 length:741 start_codon:yes stop_codon:yes gene_type:complete